MQDMIKAFEAARLFDGYEAVRFFNDANDGTITRGRRAEPARIDFGEIVTYGAENDALLNFTECGNQALNFGFRRPHEMKREPLR